MLHFLNDTFQFCLPNLCRKLKLSLNLTTLHTLPARDSQLSSVLLKRAYPKCRCAEFWEPLLRDWGWPIFSFRRYTNSGKLRPLDQTAQVNKGPSIILSSGTSVVATMAVVSYSSTEAAKFYLFLFDECIAHRFTSNCHGFTETLFIFWDSKPACAHMYMRIQRLIKSIAARLGRASHLLLSSSNDLIQWSATLFLPTVFGDESPTGVNRRLRCRSRCLPITQTRAPVQNPVLWPSWM